MSTFICTAPAQHTDTPADFSNCMTSTYSGLHISLWPYDDEIEVISPRDMAQHLSKIIYFPESVQPPFSAAQYAVELANSLQGAAAHVRLYALLKNAHEAYLGYVSPAVRAAEKLMFSNGPEKDSRDALEAAFSDRIYKALNVLGLQTAVERNLITNEDLEIIEYAKRRLDTTLERDLGVYIHKPNNNVCVLPLPRSLVPLPWDRASEAYLRTYQKLILTARKMISADSNL